MVEFEQNTPLRERNDNDKFIYVTLLSCRPTMKKLLKKIFLALSRVLIVLDKLTG